MKAALCALLAIALGGCAINIHPKGQCPTPGVSPLASNCPSTTQEK